MKIGLIIYGSLDTLSGGYFYDRKLVWFERLAEWCETNHSPTDPLVVTGDFNVAPEDRDVWSMKACRGSTHVTAPERAAVERLERQEALGQALARRRRARDELLALDDLDVLHRDGAAGRGRSPGRARRHQPGAR